MSGGHLVARALLVGALVAGFALGGCGRKGALDPPPSAAISGDQPMNAPPSLGEPPNPFSSAPPNESLPPVPSTTPTGPQAQKKNFILDPLLR